MPTPKQWFPMTYWEREDTIITLGGFDGKKSKLSEVQCFLRKKNQWLAALPRLPEEIAASSATVLNEVLYNIGGGGSTYSVVWVDLLSAKRTWKSKKTVGLVADFSDHRLRDAAVLKNAIVYFGSNCEEATYVLEPKEELEVKSKFQKVSYFRGNGDSSFCTWKDKIYYFPLNRYTEVFSLDLKKSSRYFSK